MTDTVLDKDNLVAAILDQVKNSSQLKYQRALLEFEDNDGGFLGDNVFETSFLIRDGLAPLIYEVSGPYDTVSNAYATIGRVYENGQRIFEADIKQQIQQRTAAMVWLFLDALKHRPEKILVVGAGLLAEETARYLKHFMPDLSSFDYHARNPRPDTFEATCAGLGITATYCPGLELGGYDTIIMLTNTPECLITADNIGTADDGTVIASLCTTSQVGEIAGDVYGRDDVQVLFDYDLTRTFTPDMQKADAAGHLGEVLFLADILNGSSSPDLGGHKNILRITGTPMQNVAVLEMLRNG